MLDTDVFGRSNDVAVEIGEGSGFLSGFDLIFGADEAIGVGSWGESPGLL